MPWAPYSRARTASRGVVGVGADLEPADLVGPAQQLEQVGILQIGNDGRELSQMDESVGAVDRDPVALLDDDVAHCELALVEVDLDRAGSDDRRLSELPRHESRVAGASAARREDAPGGEHAVDVVGLGLGPDHDDVLAVVPGPALGGVGVEGDGADRGSGRDIQALGDGLVGVPCLLSELGMQEEVDLLGLDAAHGLVAVDQALCHHVDGDPHLGLRRALAVAGLQDPELVALDGELDVLHVAVVRLELARDARQFGVDLGHLAFESAQGARWLGFRRRRPRPER